MTRAWNRQLGQFVAPPYFSGFFIGPTLFPGETALRSYWAVNLWHQQSLSGYPPGTAVIRAGLIAWDTTSTPPGPISNPTAEWMDIETIWPEQHVTEATNIDWWLFYKLGNPDKSVKSQRKNNNAINSISLMVSWEMMTATDTNAFFQIDGWSATVDAYINTP